MELYEILLRDIQACSDAADLCVKQNNMAQLEIIGRMYHNLAEMYLALTGIEVRPNA